MTTRSTRRERWGDDRLEAAFAVRASRTRTPPDLLEATRMMLVAVPMRATSWRRLLVPAAVLVLAIGTLGGGVALLGDRPGAGTFRDGPSVGLKTFDGGEFAFDYPAAWLGYDSSAAFSGGSSIAVLGTQPVEPQCGDERHVDINCVHEQTLEPGDIRVFIGTGAYRGGTLLDRADIENGTSTRLEIDGMPAIRDEFAPRPDSYYHEDMLVHWSIVRPGMDGTNVIRIEAMLREPGVAASRAQLDALIASFRFQDRVAPSPTESPVASEAADLPITSVRDAIAIRDSGVDDRELAVFGWYAAHAPSRACGRLDVPEPVSPLQIRCPDQLLWLTQDREQLTTMTATSTSWRGPTSPAISPHFDDVDMAWSAQADDPYRPVELVVIGHFDDARSGLCPAAEELACRDRFVVDRIDSIGGVEQPLSVVDLVDGAELSRPKDIRAAVEREAPRRPISQEPTGGVPSRPWPPDGATIVELTKVGSGRPPVRVAVVDQTRHLVEARAATAAEAALRDITLRAVWANDLADRRVLVQWGGSMCDDRLVLTIRASEAGAPAALLLDGRRTSPCRLALLHNAIVLQFDTDVSEADLFRAYRIGD